MTWEKYEIGLIMTDGFSYLTSRLLCALKYSMMSSYFLHYFIPINSGKPSNTKRHDFIQRPQKVLLWNINPIDNDNTDDNDDDHQVQVAGQPLSCLSDRMWRQMEVPTPDTRLSKCSKTLQFLKKERYNLQGTQENIMLMVLSS